VALFLAGNFQIYHRPNFRYFVSAKVSFLAWSNSVKPRVLVVVFVAADKFSHVAVINKKPVSSFATVLDDGILP